MHIRLLAFLLVSWTLFVGQAAPPPYAKIFVEDISLTSDSLVSSEHLQQLRQEITKQQYGQDALWLPFFG